MPPRAKGGSEGPDYNEYEGFLDPQPGDTGDDSEFSFDFAHHEKFVAKNQSKHNCTSVEIEQVFANIPVIRGPLEAGNVEGEDKFVALGRTHGGRYLFIAFLQKRDGRIMPISSYDMSPKMRSEYERLKQKS